MTTEDNSKQDKRRQRKSANALARELLGKPPRKEGSGGKPKKGGK